MDEPYTFGEFSSGSLQMYFARSHRFFGGANEDVKRVGFF